MKTLIRICSIAMLLLVTSSTMATPPGVPGPEFSGGVVLGYYGGFGVQVNAMISNFAQGFPLAVRGGIGYASVDPGKALDARRIFINDATNGTPEEGGHFYDFRLDFMYPVKILGLKQAYAFGGPRYSKFTGNFKFIGGNEDFDVISKQWGIGAGLESYFPMSFKMDLVFTAGVDYYSDATLTGHDTSYSPDGDDANPRNDYTFDDADEAVDQPKFEPRLMIGIRYKF